MIQQDVALDVEIGDNRSIASHHAASCHMASSQISEGISETVQSASEYISALTELLKQIGTVEAQVKVTAEKSRGVIDHHFPYVVGAITSLLDQRQGILQNQVLEMRERSLQPLEECRELVNEKLAQAQTLIKQGEKILGSSTKEELSSFCEKASLLGSLPEIPDSGSVANIRVSFDESVLNSLLSTLKDYGKIQSQSPLHICAAHAFPGAIYIQWAQAEEEDDELEDYVFCVQCCLGNVYKDKLLGQKLSTLSHNYFRIMFKGRMSNNENGTLVRGLEANVPYSFRVGRQIAKDEKESPTAWEWSQPFIASTCLNPYGWDTNNTNYISSGGTTTRAVENTGGMITSDHCLSRGNHLIRFRVLEVGITANIDEGVGLVHGSPMTFGNEDSLFINIQGCICVGNKEMSSRLPNLESGSEVTFELEPLNQGKVRVKLESRGRQVICDWNVTNTQHIKFACLFRCPAWKIHVD